MLKVTAISDIAYLTESAADALTAVVYYTNSKAKPPERWWFPGGWIVLDGPVAPELGVMRLAQGRHPGTGRKLAPGKGEQKRAAIDLTFSAPRSWTALWVVGNKKGLAILNEMLLEAACESLDEVFMIGTNPS